MVVLASAGLPLPRRLETQSVTSKSVHLVVVDESQLVCRPRADTGKAYVRVDERMVLEVLVARSLDEYSKVLVDADLLVGTCVDHEALKYCENGWPDHRMMVAGLQSLGMVVGRKQNLLTEVVQAMSWRSCDFRTLCYLCSGVLGGHGNEILAADSSLKSQLTWACVAQLTV